ncbi:MAG: GldG family protein [Tyzzerella sp.]|nr:GldG family protein [Tyzzerella sp.]
MKKIKEMFGSAQSRYGTYSTLLTVIAIVVVIMINMVAGEFPESWKNIDLSSNDLYEITDQSKELLNGLDKEVKLHVLAEKSSTDERIQIFIEKYAGLSKKISVEWTDPVLHPTVLEEYNADSNTIVVECLETEKQTQILFDDIIAYDEMSYYYYGSYVETEFDAEGQLTSAVNYVTNETSQKIYRTSGHGETSFSTTVSDLMTKSNYTVEELNTLMVTEIPEDCDLLFMYAPATDLSEDEKTMISEYLVAGGDMYLVLGTGENETPNLDALMLEYGMQKVDGYIADTSRNYQGNAYYIFPELSVSGDLAAGISSEMVLLVNSLGMEVTDPARDTISVSEFMTTSSKGFAVTSEAQTEGTYVLGAVATEEESTFTVLTAYSMIDSYVTDAFSNLENVTLFMNTVANHFEEVSNIAIEPKSLEVTYNTVQYAGISSLVAIFGIPIVILGYGFVKWLKRRKA